MALLQNKPCQFYGHQKIYVQTKFELSKLILALSGPNFLFRPLNKLGHLVDFFKIARSDCAHPAQDKFSQVWSTSVNFKDHFMDALCRTVDNPICSIYDVRLNNAKKKKWMPYGHQKNQAWQYDLLVDMFLIWYIYLAALPYLHCVVVWYVHCLSYVEEWVITSHAICAFYTHGDAHCWEEVHILLPA